MANTMQQMTQTQNFNLDLPPYGTPDWHIFVNLNFKKIDEFVKNNLVSSQQPIASEGGSHEFRYWRGRLEYFFRDTNTWVPIIVNGNGNSGSIGSNAGSTGIIVSSGMPYQGFGEYWYEVPANAIEESNYDSDNAGGTNIVVLSNMPHQEFGEFWYEVSENVVEEGGIMISGNRLDTENLNSDGVMVVVSEDSPSEMNNTLWLDT